MDSQPIFIEYLGIGINAAEIRTITPVGEGLHIDFIHGGFLDLDRGSVTELLVLADEARKALAPF